MMLLFIYLFTLLFGNTTGEDPKIKSIFISPVKIPLSLSANFGELRTDHFHSGVDIKTQGVTGKEIIATAPGYVYRISISPGGFGKALYLRHPSGYSTVYGHLDRFVPEIEEYVISRQYEEKSYMITLWPAKNKFRFEQGDLIAYSGNTGSSSGPHLHYEVRKSDQEIPVNPLIFDFGINDDIKPVIENLVVYPIGKNTKVNNQNKPVRIYVTGSNGKYHIPSGHNISINGAAGFGIKSYDLISNRHNKCSVYSIDLKIDSISVYSFKMDAFAFSESRYINSHIDYEMLQRDKVFIERAFLLPNNRLRIYSNVVNNGIFKFSDERRHLVEFIVADIHNNISTLSFYVNSLPSSVVENGSEPVKKNAVMMPYNRNNRFVSGKVSVEIPAGALYDTLYFEFGKSEAMPGMYSGIYHIHNKFTPLHQRYDLAIEPDHIPAGLNTKMLIIQLNDESGNLPLTSTWDNGYLRTSSSTFGSFYIGIDTIPPKINAVGFSAGANLEGKENMKIRIKDDLSGIKSYEPVIDGRWALFEYDQKNDILIYRFDKARIEKGSRHFLSLKVSDNKDNVSTYTFDFNW